MFFFRILKGFKSIRLLGELRIPKVLKICKRTNHYIPLKSLNIVQYL